MMPEDLTVARKSLHFAGGFLDTAWDSLHPSLPTPHRLILRAAMMAVAEVRSFVEERWQRMVEVVA